MIRRSQLSVKLTCVMLLSCCLCVVSPFSRLGETQLTHDEQEEKVKDSSRHQYQQHRRRLQRQLAQQPAGHCFQVWDDTTANGDRELDSICTSENWSLLDFTQRKDHSTLLSRSLSASSSSLHDSVVVRPAVSMDLNPNVDLMSSITQRRLANHQHQHRFTRTINRKTTCFRRWMTLLSRRLGNARLGDLVIPGTHNSASFSVSPNGTLVEKLWISRVALSLGFHDYFSSWARNHDDGLRAQLNAGYRCLDLRIAVLPNGGFYWWHGISGEAIDAGLRDIADFAKDNPGEIIILLISHLNAPGDGDQEKLPMPLASKIKLGQHLLSILGSTLVPTRNISLNPTLSSVIATGRNVIALIREDQDLVNAFPDYFWSDVNNETAVEMFERRTNPRSMFTHRSDIMQKYKRNFPDRMAITPAFVTHNVPNILGGILRSTRVAWALSTLLIVLFYSMAKSWDNRKITSIMFRYGLNKRRKPTKLANVTIIYLVLITLSVSLGHLQHRTILNMFGFEGKATNLLEMARIANLCGDDPSKANGDVMYRSINSMIRHWSDRDYEYRLNIVLVDDFSSSQVVRTAIQENIRRTDTHKNTRQKYS